MFLKISGQQAVNRIPFTRGQCNLPRGQRRAAPFGKVIAFRPRDAFIDPGLDQSNLLGLERLALGGHAFIGIFGSNQLIQQAVGAVSGLGGVQQRGAAIDRKPALGLMA